jgi:endonuclease I
MKRSLLTTICLAITSVVLMAQPNGTGTYYQKAHGKKGRELKTAMYEIINTPSVMDYDSLWTAYRTSDAIPTDTVPIIWDMYSCNSAYSIYTNLHRNGKYGTDPEGTKGFQREHSMPKSWFNPAAKSGSSYTYKDIWPMYSDLAHVIPAEGIVNNKRSNNPYGTNNGEWYGSEPDPNDPEQKPFSKMGKCTYIPEGLDAPVYTGRCFEPNDEYKGDIARIYFYMVTAYEKRQPTWSGTDANIGDHCGTWTGDMFNLEDDDPYQPFAPWAFDLLMKWSKNDPVSQKEIDRNEEVWRMQGNRNPFVDYPGLEIYIWGDQHDEAFDYGGELPENEPTSDNCEIALNKTTFNVDWHPTEERKAELAAEGKDWTLYDNLREYYDRIPLTIDKDNVTITFSYGICGKYLYADDDQIRLYNYNTLTFRAHNNKITKVEFTLGESNHADKKVKAFVGTMSDNIWTGEEDEVLFTTEYVQSKYNAGTKTTTNYYAALTNVNITVANPSGIEQLMAERFYDDNIYTLQGVRVDTDQLRPGIYIKHGRKFVVK